MKNKYLIRINCVLLSLCIIQICFSGCGVLLDKFLTGLSESRVESENLKIFSAKDYTSYEYSDKVVVILSDNDNNDSLSLATTEDDDWWYKKKEVLSGRFDKVSWNDYILFINMEEKYYTFDINEYEIPSLDGESSATDIDYELKEYSETEFITAYPNYNSFDWYGH